ncbi:thioredoxin family protein [Parapedobacter tibetensis]|uniref:thioredoxin family protein n=1 Tax=Parapedobacter tibetensis TaxID=2972951 RepID=UPI00214DC827|nr:thioredoxin family protein [Parapedobacter tibetensis]
MNTLPFIRIMILAALPVFFACRESPREQTKATAQIRYAYTPKYGTLRIASDVNNPEITAIKLFNDKRTDSLTAVETENGAFMLVVDELPFHEVYFLEISGKSTRKGTNGLSWTEHIPICFEGQADLSLEHRFFDHPGSISKVEFSIAGGGEEQQLLNEWQEALNHKQADVEGQVVGFGQLSASPDQDAEGIDITQQFLQQKKPLVASLFLAYTTNDHRRHTADYLDLYMSLPPQSQHTKYGIDLIQRLDRIRAPIQHLNPYTQVVAVDHGLKPVNWEAFNAHKYLLLSFWKSTDKTSHANMKQIVEKLPQLEQQGTAVVYLSLDNKFSRWKSASEAMNLKHSYKLRNGVQQKLIDSLYLTELPRYILIQPDGAVVDADVSVEELPKLLKLVE